MSITMSGVGGALTPAPAKATLSSNYLGSNIEFTRTELPDVYEKEFEKYGNRSIASFLRLTSSEMPSASDVIQWTEQGRLHLVATGATRAGDVITSNAHPFRVNQTVTITDGTNSDKAIVTAVTTNTFDVASFSGANLNASLGLSALSIYAWGSEFKKGTNGMSGSLEAAQDIQSTSPIIIKDMFEISGSDMAQIGWIKGTTEAGDTGYFWYLKSEGEARLRFEDNLETSMIEATPAASGSGAASAGYKGTKGLFYEIENRGNIATGTFAAKSDIENVIKVLDKEGAIQENAVFSNRTTSFEIDDVLAGLNNFGSSGASYGLFDNDQDMALSLGFKGFNLGYDFYKTDWKYLNDPTSAGAAAGVDGVIVPVGTKTVYDSVLGANAVLPFLHVKYRKTATEDRKYKTTIIGSAGGANNSDLDAMQVHFLSERALCVMGANNFVLLK